jgi:hypothetical protein
MHVWDLFHIQWRFSPSGSMELEIKNENEMKVFISCGSVKENMSQLPLLKNVEELKNNSS